MRTTETTAMEMMGWRGRALVQELKHRLARVLDAVDEDEMRARTAEESGLLAVAAEHVAYWLRWVDDDKEWLLGAAMEQVEGDPAKVTWEVFTAQLVFEIDAEIEALGRVREALTAPPLDADGGGSDDKHVRTGTASFPY